MDVSGLVYRQAQCYNVAFNTIIVHGRVVALALNLYYLSSQYDVNKNISLASGR